MQTHTNTRQDTGLRKGWSLETELLKEKVAVCIMQSQWELPAYHSNSFLVTHLPLPFAIFPSTFPHELWLQKIMYLCINICRAFVCFYLIVQRQTCRLPKMHFDLTSHPRQDLQRNIFDLFAGSIYSEDKSEFKASRQKHRSLQVQRKCEDINIVQIISVK